MYAVIGIGGKQVRVTPGETVRVESLTFDPGTSVIFDRVLMVGGEQGTLVGTPVVQGAKVLATVLEHDRAKKVLIFKKKKRKQYRRTNGHRQGYTAVRIDEIETEDGGSRSRGEAASVQTDDARGKTRKARHDEANAGAIDERTKAGDIGEATNTATSDEATERDEMNPETET